MINPLVKQLIDVQTARKLPVSKVCEKIGYPTMTMYRWLRGLNSPHLFPLIAWANYLGFELMLVPKEKLDEVNKFIATDTLKEIDETVFASTTRTLDRSINTTKETIDNAITNITTQG